MSERNGMDQTHRQRPRVIKSHQVEGARPAFPELSQIAPGDLPSSRLEPIAAAKQEAALRQPPVAEVRGSIRLMEEARAAQERARALERRAAALLQEAEETAAARIREAEEQAREMLARAEAEVEQVREAARQAGYEEGHAEGLRAGRAEGEAEGKALVEQARAEAEQIAQAARQELDAVRMRALQERARVLEASGQQVLRLAFAVARQVLKAEVQLRPEAMLPMLEAALARMKGEEEPEVRVSPAVQAVLEEHRGRLLAAIPGARRLKVEADPSLEPGDFVIQGSQGYVNGRIDRQVEVLEERALPEGDER